MTEAELRELVTILAERLRLVMRDADPDDAGWKSFCLLELTEPQRDAVGFPRWPESTGRNQK